MRKLAQTSPSPDSLPAVVSPNLDSISPPAPSTDPDQLTDPLPSLFPPPLAPTLENSPPPAATVSPPPATPNGPPPASSPPPVTESPPPSQTPPPPSTPPPSPPPSSVPTLSPPPPSPPPPELVTSPPPVVSPPPSPSAVPPPKSSPPPPEVIPSSPPPQAEKPASPPPPTEKPASPPPADTPTSPPPAERPASPPPADKPAPTPTAERPPPPSPPPADKATSPSPAKSPPSKFSPSQPSPPPPVSLSAPPPIVAITPPPPAPSSPFPFPTSPPPPTTNTSEVGVPPTSQLPLIPAEKPFAKPTNDTGVPVNASSKATGGSGGAVAISVVVAFVVLGLVATAVLFVRKRKHKKSKMTFAYPAASPYGSPSNSDSYLLKPPAPLQVANSSSKFTQSPSEQGGMNNSRSWFTYEELACATDWFSADNELGEGGFGKVYKGVLAEGREVAVKQLKAGGGQGEREFRAEVEIISRIHHRHLVSLVGYCIAEQQRLLVYDYVPNNTLHYHLHGIGRPIMEWSIRVKVAAGAARGLAYLHEDCNPRIIHRDIKSSNILIDNNYDAKVADFGLAKLAMELDSQTHVSTRVMGTFGYMAPEYATTGKLTEKSDVYSFGVVLLELITGHKPIDDSGPLGDESLVEWARPRLAQALESEVFDQLVDPRLEGNYSASEMFRLIEATAACVRHQATRRPKMSQVVRALDTIGEESGQPNGMKFGQSEVYDSAEQSAQIRMFQRMAFGNGSSQDYSLSYISDSQSSWRY